MSLEQEISSLVTATTQLTGEVIGKMAQIDARVEQKRGELDAWRNGYRNEDAVGIQVFVSANGSDANSGTEQAPVQTLAKAVSLLPRLGRIDLLSDLTIANAGVDCGRREIDVFMNGHTIRFMATPSLDTQGVNVGTGFDRITNWRRLMFYYGSLVMDPIASTGNGNAWFYRIRRSPLVADGTARFAALGFNAVTLNIGANVIGASAGWHAEELYGLVSGYAVVSRFDTNTALGTGAVFALGFDIERGMAHDGTL